VATLFVSSGEELSESPVIFSSDVVNGNPAPKGNFDPGSALSFDHLSDRNPYRSYSGADISVSFTFPGGETIYIGSLQTLSYSIHRENTPVRIIGHSSPISFVKGSRTIAGSMIFTVFNTYAFYQIKCLQDKVLAGNAPLADQLPPFDITISFVNEYGSFSKMKILGVSIVDEGGTMSIDDIITEQTYTYIARGIQPMVAYMPGYLTEPTGATAQAISGRTTETQRTIVALHGG
jgi:hypothetical protein